MVPPRPKRLATSVQGLGSGALLLVVLSGLIWFILWRNGSSFAGLALETHKNVTLLIELYLIDTAVWHCSTSSSGNATRRHE